MQARAPWPVPAELGVALVNGYPLAYRDVGAGPPLVLIHGSFNDYRTWNAQLALLAVRCRVIAPSLRHYYPEPWSGADADFEVEQHADDVAVLIRELRLDQPCVLGHSRGGAVALTLARNDPDSLGALLLADPRGLEGLLPRSAEGQVRAGELHALFDALQARLRAGDRELAARTFVDALTGAGSWERRTPELKQMFFDNIATAVDDGRAPALACADVPALTERRRVLILNGSRSPPRYHAMAAAFLACSEGRAHREVIHEAGHAMHRDHPEAFARAVLAFADP